MVFSGLLGTGKQLRRRSSAASFRSTTLRPTSSSSANASRGVLGARADDDEAVAADDKSDAASVRTANSDAHSTRPASPLPPDYIADETHLPPLSPEAPDLRELNNSLDALAVAFPDVQVDVFREMLTSFDGESRLALVADALLKNRATWVKGRWRIADKEADNQTSRSKNDKNDKPSVCTADKFRTPEYKKAARSLASNKFAGLSKSTINAVLAEQNYSYLDAHRVLVPMSAKSWRFMIHSFFSRRSPVTHTEAEHHPLVVWKSTGHGAIMPAIKATGSAELDRELYDALIAPLLAQKRAAQEDADHTMASELNTEEAEAAGATHECTCCFATATFEQVTTCSNGQAAHIVCFRCVQHSVREAVFGQGWARTIDPSRGTLRCPAVDSKDCDGVIPADYLCRALLDEQRGGDTLLHLERRLADFSLVGSGLPLVRCPFCEYAEVDDIYVPFHEAPLRVRVDSLYTMALIFFLFGATPVLMLPFLVFIILVTLLPGFVAVLAYFSSIVHTASTIKTRRPSPARKQGYLRGQFSAAITRFRRRRRGHQFRCQNPACARLSCLACSKAWTDIHVCHESSLVALRTQVEQAMSMAIKRVCPRCHTSFVKTVGCNKLTCPCGYKMCYVCRKDISGTEGPDAGYRHFCDHFRPHGDGRACNQCRKCNLWETEDTEAVLQAARKEAERKWRETERRELSSSERAYLETGIAIGGGSGGSGATGSGSSTARAAPASYSSLAHAAPWLVALPFSWLFTDSMPSASTPSDDADGSSATYSKSHVPSFAEVLDWLLECLLV